MNSVNLDSAVRTVSDEMPVGAILANEHGRIVYANTAAQRILDATEEELAAPGHDCVDAQRLAAYARLEGLESEQGGRRIRILTRNGARVFVEVTPTFLRGESGETRILVTLRDIGTEVRMERRLAAQHETAQALLRGDDLLAVLQLVAEHSCRVFDGVFASITMPYPSGAGLTLAASHTVGGEDYFTEGVWPADSICREVLCSANPRLIDGPAFPRPPRRDPDPRIGCGYVLPILSSEMAMGVLAVAVPDGHPAHRERDFATAADYAAELGETLGLGLASLQREHQAQQTKEQLEKAMATRIIIEQAKGMLAATHSTSPDEAFALLHSYARTRKLPTSFVAGCVVERTLSL